MLVPVASDLSAVKIRRVRGVSTIATAVAIVATEHRLATTKSRQTTARGFGHSSVKPGSETASSLDSQILNL